MGQKTTILNSELAVQILSAIASRTDGDYCTNLADELDKSQPSISRVLSELHEIGFIEKGPREKFQYYRINYEKIADYWYNRIHNKLKEREKTEELKELEKNSDKTKELASNFFQEFLESTSISNITVSCLLFRGFTYSIGYNVIKNRDLLEENKFLDPVLEGLKFYIEEKAFSGGICSSMEISVEETLE